MRRIFDFIEKYIEGIVLVLVLVVVSSFIVRGMAKGLDSSRVEVAQLKSEREGTGSGRVDFAYLLIKPDVAGMIKQAIVLNSIGYYGHEWLAPDLCKQFSDEEILGMFKEAALIVEDVSRRYTFYWMDMGLDGNITAPDSLFIDKFKMDRLERLVKDLGKGSDLTVC